MSIFSSMLESVKDSINSTESYLIIFYQHCLKWKYQKTRQGTSWIRSIIDNSKYVYGEIYNKKSKKINKNIINKIDLYECYKKGLLKAIEETKINIRDNNGVFDCFNSFDKIIDSNYVKEWMRIESINSDIIDMIDKKR